jgi:hypothetical protein
MTGLANLLSVKKTDTLNVGAGIMCGTKSPRYVIFNAVFFICIRLCIYLSIYPSIHLSLIYLSVRPSVHPSIHPSIELCMCLYNVGCASFCNV